MKNKFKNKEGSTNKSTQGGFLELIIVIIVALLLLNYFHLTVSGVLAHFNLTIGGIIDWFKNLVQSVVR